jgi:hypothetical protein
MLSLTSRWFVEPNGNRNGPNAVSLSYQVGNGPMVFATLELGGRCVRQVQDGEAHIQQNNRERPVMLCLSVSVFGSCKKARAFSAVHQFPQDRLVTEVLSQEPSSSAHRVFWIMDNGSAHRGQKSIDRLKSQWPDAILVHTPIHASWLNQAEIYFCVVQGKVLQPNNLSCLAELEQRLLAFQIITIVLPDRGGSPPSVGLQTTRLL